MFANQTPNTRLNGRIQISTTKSHVLFERLLLLWKSITLVPLLCDFDERAQHISNRCEINGFFVMFRPQNGSHQSTMTVQSHYYKYPFNEYTIFEFFADFFLRLLPFRIISVCVAYLICINYIFLPCSASSHFSFLFQFFFFGDKLFHSESFFIKIRLNWMNEKNPLIN